MVTYSISGIPVIDKGQLVGIVTHRDIRYEENLEQPAFQVMTPKERLITAKEQASPEEIVDLLRRHSLEKILIVDESYNCRGLMTAID